MLPTNTGTRLQYISPLTTVGRDVNLVIQQYPN